MLAFDEQVIKDLSIISYISNIDQNKIDEESHPRKLIAWNNIRPFLYGVGKRTWFLHDLKYIDKKDEVIKMIKKTTINSQQIS